MHQKPYVLISDVNSRKAFDVANIVERKLGYRTLLCSAKDYSFQLVLIYSQRVYRLRFDTYDAFLADLKAIEEVINAPIIYLPVSEIATRHYIKARDNAVLSDQFLSLLPDQNQFELTSDKWRFQQFCEKNKHPVPRSIKEENYNQLFTNFKPVVLKPKHGQGSVGIRYFNHKEELPQSHEIDWENSLIQEKVIAKDRVAGSFFLAEQGKVINSYCHQRIRTFPVSGGVTVFSKSVEYPEIIRAGSRLISDLNWSGLAMIEFMYDVISKEWRIIELNPRLWGSIMLADYCDSNLIGNYLRICSGDSAENVDKKVKKDVFIRWFYPFEILSFFQGNISLKELIRFNKSRTCYVNFTYSTLWRSISYLLYFSINLRSVSRFFQKLKK